jgi:hypothetical protein
MSRNWFALRATGVGSEFARITALGVKPQLGVSHIDQTQLEATVSDVTRRDAVKLVAAGVAVGAGVLSTKAAHGQEGKKVSDATQRWEGHRLADPKTLAKVTKACPVSMGVKPPGDMPPVVDLALIKELDLAQTSMGMQHAVMHWGGPRPDLNGLRVKFPNQPEIYLIDRGYRRWIPNPATYNNLFRDWEGIVVDIDINEIPLAPQITSGAVLVRADGTAPVYLVDSGVKRWIVSPAMMDKYYFNWNRVYVLPAGSVDPIPMGPNIDS